MKSKLSAACAVGAIMLLAACTSGTQQVQTVQPQAGNDFTRALAGHYKDMSANQFGGQADFWSASERFADKSMRAAPGEAVAPDQVGQGLLRTPVKMGSDLTAARARMSSAFQNGSTTTYPAASARAQAAFDCWLDEASDPIFAVEGPWLDAKVQNCRTTFDTAMTELSQTRTTSSVPAAPAGTPLAQAPAPRAPAREQSYLVFFDFDRANITSEAETILRRAAVNVKQGGVSRVLASGHADRSGTDAYNMALSQRRANAVRDFLAREGVPTGQIQTVARGEAQPLVPTPDGVREPQNRRVEITLDQRVAGN